MEDRKRGIVLGGIIGDVLGIPIEGWSSYKVYDQFPNGIHDYLQNPLRYSDDSEMTLALMEVISEHHQYTVEEATRGYMKHFDMSRGYGATALKVMVDLLQGADPHTSGTRYFPDGSHGNGAVMRIAPVAVAYSEASMEELQERVRNAVWCTHTHPIALESAFLHVYALIYLMKSNVATFAPAEMIKDLLRLAKEPTIKNKLTQLLMILTHISPKPLNMTVGDYFRSGSWSQMRAAAHLLADPFQIRADDCLATALLTFCCQWQDPAAVISMTLAMGGDTDTITKVAAELTFALHGASAIPKKWISPKLEGYTRAMELLEKITI